MSIKQKIKSILTPGYKKVLRQLEANQNETRAKLTDIRGEQAAQCELLYIMKAQNCELKAQSEEILNNQRQILDELSQLRYNTDFLQKSIDNVYERTIVLDQCINTVFNYTATVRDNLDAYYKRIDGTINGVGKYTNLEYVSSLLTDRRTSGKKILIAGFYGAYNLGDELMLQTLLSYVPEEMYGSVTVLLYKYNDYVQLDLPPVNFLHYPSSFFEYDFLAKEFDVLIWGGGALVDDTYYPLRHTNLLGNMIVDMSERFIAFGKKVIGVGLSTSQKLTDENYTAKLKELIPKFDSFSVRDKYSYKLLKDMGIDGVTEAPDIVFSSEYFKEGKENVKNGEVKSVGVTFVCAEETKAPFFKLIDIIRKQYGNDCEIKCIPFFDCDRNDVSFYEQWKKEAEGFNITVCDYKNTLEDVCAEMASTDITVNMRYHAMVLSQMLGKPSLNICYDTSPHYYNKVSHLMEEFETKQNMIHLNDFADEKFDTLGALLSPKPRHDLFEAASDEIKGIFHKIMR